MQVLIDGIDKMIKMEKDLERNKSIDGYFSQSSKRKW